ncbi:MAG: helix-turn-helix domain-containing protein [Lachnospiraceae bacterium]|nr:helix-turn-helix domain-containing protein [Lachnospiraceae bacterium]
MPVIRIEKNTGYTTMSNYHLRDGDLSLKAKGLLSLFLSLPESWIYSINGLVAICKEGRSGIASGLKELEEKGYLHRERRRDEKGLLRDNVYVIYERPQKPKVGKPISENLLLDDMEAGSAATGNQAVENPEAENPTLENLTLESPEAENPTLENPALENPTQENPAEEKPAQENRTQLIKEVLSKEIINTDLIDRECEREPRHRHGAYRNVLLSDSDFLTLQKEFPRDYEQWIERLSEYMASTGKSYKNHLATIRCWARRERQQNGGRKYSHDNYRCEEGESL